MGLRAYKPTSAGRRFATVLDFEEITKTTPEKSLLVSTKKSGGRNNAGRTTSRFRGGGHKRMLRVIDFRRNKDGVPGKVAAIEYDPNRSARLALLHYADGEKRYILWPVGLKVGDVVFSGEKVEPRVGNCMPLRSIPQGLAIHNLELTPGKGAQLVRTAGGVAQLAAKEGEYAQVSLPSGEIRLIHLSCRATIGQVGNLDHQNVWIGKAGRRRWMGRRPHNRGTSMNPVAHPLGGGEGRTGGGRHPCSPTGKLCKGKKTRRRRNRSSAFIVRRRK
ncbi:MAG: 50S ribosomal protein L2 [Planctomycetes bacterium]|nr:50S ribosomal protein L2 [Planctomycetota bacterium]MBI3846668.1 50S ribosomal protein L2 [Planctomycetota bacterium]